MVIKVHSNTFFRYNDNDKIRSLCINLFQINGCVRHFKDGNKTIHLKVTDKKLLKRYIKIWGKISSLMEPVFVNNYGEYIKTKIKSCGDKINTNLCNERKKITKKGNPM